MDEIKDDIKIECPDCGCKKISLGFNLNDYRDYYFVCKNCGYKIFPKRK